ncbi:MAG TPA: hypothetical protein VJB94_03045 [Candidatus Nanoarchaeia archaeon]|nr:hypothetical protein [Candidatus Nanoarchaeia archaeon]
MNKKADEDIGKNIPLSFLAVFVLIPALLGVRYIATAGVYKELEIGNAEPNLIIDRLVYSKDCLAYDDGSRVYPGVIDLNKLTEERIGNCLKKEGLAIKLTINNQDYYNDKFLFISISNECPLKVSKVTCLTKKSPIVTSTKENTFLEAQVILQESG